MSTPHQKTSPNSKSKSPALNSPGPSKTSTAPKLHHKLSTHAKYLLITIFCIAISLIAGYFLNDFFLGSAVLASGLLCAYFASEGKRINYILSLLSYLLMGYVAFENQLYGIVIFYFLVFAPLQIYGFFSWSKNLNQDKNVKARAFTLKTSIIITISCIVSSLIVAALLNLIPHQQMVFLIAASNCINLCGVILLALRFRESWWLWLVNNIIDLIIWIIATTQHGTGAVMMLLTSIGYLLINIYGLIRWEIESHKSQSLASPKELLPKLPAK